MTNPVDTASAAPVLQSIGQIAVRVKDLPRAVRFYREVLGDRKSVV